MSPRPSAARRGSPYPRGFVYGRGVADPHALSLTGLKLKRALAALKPVHGEVLELGCGGGQYLRGLRRFRPDLRLVGLDLDPEAVAASSKITGSECRLGDAARLPFKANRFQAVIGFDILEHVPDPGRVLAEARRVLTAGGVLHLYVPCEGNPGTVYTLRGHGLKARWGGHRQQFTSDGLLQLLTQQGFQVQQVRHSDHWLTQQFDFAFFRHLDRSRDPQALWAAQALTPGPGIKGWTLRMARRLLSVLTWAEGQLRRGPRGAMGLHVTALKT